MNSPIRNNITDRKTVNAETLQEYSVSTYILNMLAASLCVFIMCCDIIAILVMRRCKRVPYQSLQLSISYLSSEAIGLIIFAIHQVLIFGFDINTDILYNSRITTVAIMHLISSASVTGIILERVFALKANLKYTLLLKRIKIHLVIAVIWLAHTFIIISVASISFYTQCNWTSANCDITEVNKIAKYCITFLTFFYDIIMVFANIIVYKIAKEHAVKIAVLKQSFRKETMEYPDRVSERQYDAMVVLVKIVTCYILFQTPIFITVFVGTNFPEIRDETPMRIVKSFSYMLFLINSFLNLYFYIFRMKECKMILFFKLGKFCKRFEHKANAIRLEVYDIVLYPKRERISPNESCL